MTRILSMTRSTASGDDRAMDRASAYVSGDMTEMEAERFEADLVDDVELFEQVAPFLSLWLSPTLLPSVAQTLADVEVDIARANARQAATDATKERRRMFWRGIAASIAGLFTLKSMLAVGGTVAVASLAWLITPGTRQRTSPPTQLVAQRPDTAPTITRPPTATATTKTPTRRAIRRSPLPAPSQRVAELEVPPLDTAGNALASKLMTPLPGSSVARAETGPLGASPQTVTVMGGYWPGDQARAGNVNPAANGAEDAKPQAKPDDHATWWSWLNPRNWHHVNRPILPPTASREGHLR